MHCAAPACGAYFPAAHDTHLLAESEPTLSEDLPTGQLLHTAKPVVAPYVPAGQAEHDAWLDWEL